MPIEEAVELLHAAHVGTWDVAPATAEALATRVGRLPLALEVVGSLTSVPGASAEALLSELPEAIDLVEEAATNPFASASATEHTLSAMQTFGPSISRLDRSSLLLLAVSSAVNVAPLPVGIVGPIARGLADDDKLSVLHALGTLLSRSLVRRLDDETFEVHGLVAGATLRSLGDPDDFVAACTSAALDGVVAALADADDLRTHRRTERVSRFGQALVSRSPGGGGHAELTALRTLGRYLHVEERYAEAVVLERRAVDLADSLLGADDLRSLQARVNLAISIGRDGRHAEAAALLDDTVAVLEDQFGPEHADVLTAKHNLANLLESIDGERGRQLALETYRVRVDVLGPDHPHTLYSLHSLLGKAIVPPGYADMVAAYEDLIARREKVEGPDHHTTLTSIHNLVVYLIFILRADEAIRWARELLRRQVQTYGSDAPGSIQARASLLAALSSSPEPDDEEVQHLLAEVSRSLRMLGARTLTAIASVGEHLRRLGRVRASLQLLDLARRASQATLDEENSASLLIEHNLAAARADAGEVTAAADTFATLVPRMEAALGPDDRLTLRAKRQQARLAARLGDPAGALERQEDLLGKWRSTTEPSSAEVAEALEDLASTLEQLGRAEEAQRYRALRYEVGKGDVRPAGYA